MNDNITHSTDIPLKLLPNHLAICRLSPEAPSPEWARQGGLLSFVWTDEELSVICEERYVPPEINADRGWRTFKVQGALDFASVGILSSILKPLAEAGISILTISTFLTDYILVKETSLERALVALRQEGYLILDDDDISA